MFSFLGKLRLGLLRPFYLLCTVAAVVARLVAPMGARAAGAVAE